MALCIQAEVDGHYWPSGTMPTELASHTCLKNRGEPALSEQRSQTYASYGNRSLGGLRSLDPTEPCPYVGAT